MAYNSTSLTEHPLGVREFKILTIQQAANRANFRMGQHPLDADEIHPSGHYMLCLMEEEIARLRRLLDTATHALQSYRYGNDSKELAEELVNKIEEELADIKEYL